MISVDRIKNFLIICLRRPPKIRENVFKQYLAIYGTEQESDRASPQGAISPKNQVILFQTCKSPVVSVIVTAYNQFDATLSCLASLQTHSQGIPYEVILADDGSIDKTLNIAAYCQNLRVCRSEKNNGYLQNCNRAAKEANGRYLFLLNNDAYPQARCLQALLDVVEHDPSVGIVGSMLVYPDGTLQEAGGIIWTDGSAHNYGRGDCVSRSEYNYLREVDYVSAAALLVRRDFWASTGGFDTRFSPAYYEDVDLAFQARDQGLKVIYQPAAVAIHEKRLSYGAATAMVDRLQSANKVRFIEKWRAVLEDHHTLNDGQLFAACNRGESTSTILVVDRRVPAYDRDVHGKSVFGYLTRQIENGVRVVFLPENFEAEQPYTQSMQQMGVEVLYGPWYRNNFRCWWRENKKYFDAVKMARINSKKTIDKLFGRSSGPKVAYLDPDLT